MSNRNNSTQLSNNLNNAKLRFGCYLKLVDFKSPEQLENILKESDEGLFELYFGIVCIILAVLNITSNSCYIHGLRRTNHKLSHIQKLFIYLSAVDLIGGCCVWPMIAIGQFYGQECLYMSIVQSLNASVTFHNGTTTCMISVLRYKAIHRPMNKSRGKNICKIVAVQNFLLLAIFCYVGYIHYFSMTEHSLKNMGLVTLVLISTIDITILVFLLMALNTIRQKAKDSRLSVNIQRRLKRQKKSANTLLIITAFSFFCLLLQIGSLALLRIQINEILGPSQTKGALMAMRTWNKEQSKTHTCGTTSK